VAAPVEAKVFYSRSEAVELAFPDAERVETKTLILDGAQTQRVEALAQAPLESKLITLYTGYRNDRVIGYALIDIHTVRTLPEAFMVVLSPAGEVRSLRVLAFYEPEEYLPPERWLNQFEKQVLSDELRLRGRIHGIAGATLSSRAITSGVRRALALFEVLVKGAAKAEGPPRSPAPGTP